MDRNASDPYLVFYKNIGPDSWIKVHRTEVIPNNLNPRWAPMKISVQRLCNGDTARPIRVKCFDFDTGDENKDDFIGEFDFNL